MKHFAAVFLVFPVLASAASLLPAVLAGQVQQFTDGGKVSGCGVTFSAVEKSEVGKVLVFNGSTVVFRNGGALVKGRASEVDAKLINSATFTLDKLKLFKTTNVWMKAPASPATAPTSGIKVSEDKSYIIYGAEFNPAFAVIRAVLENESIQIGFQVVGRNAEQVLFGTTSISTDERDQLIGCIKELAQ